MADDERHDDKSLELPSLRSALRRRRPPGPEPEPEPAPTVVPADVASASSAAPTEASRDPGAGTAPDEGTESRRRLPRLELLLRRAKGDRQPRRLRVPGAVAALVTGAVVGLVMVGLTGLSLRVCSALRGTSSCGKPGLLLLLAIIVLAVLLGSLLLRASAVDAPGSTSLLGVALLVVLILLALLPVLDEWWAAMVVPAVAMLAYLASWWVTTTYAEPGERPR
jgi:hypothetical protein